MKTVIVSNPCGYCFGVSRALKMVYDYHKEHQKEKLKVLGNLVHNEDVSAFLKCNGIDSISYPDNLIDKVELLSSKDTAVFSAHGHDKKIEKILNAKGIKFIDTTCPIVIHSFRRIQHFIEQGYDIIYIGQSTHPETIAALSIDKNVILLDIENLSYSHLTENRKLFCTNQTTLSVTELDECFKKVQNDYENVIFEDEICNETRKRQEAVLKMDKNLDVVYVVGGSKSSNTRKLFNIAKKHFNTKHIYKILNKKEVDTSILINASTIGIISGASTPLETSVELKTYIESL